jgi:hypothetical protein
MRKPFGVAPGRLFSRVTRGPLADAKQALHSRDTQRPGGRRLMLRYGSRICPESTTSALCAIPIAGAGISFRINLPKAADITRRPFGLTLAAGNPLPAPAQGKVSLRDGERGVFTEESNPQSYLKLIASGEADETMWDA